MPSYYSVVQYAPDPVRDERVNVGVVAFRDGEIRSLFLQNWQRVKQFVGGRDVGFLRDIEREARHWDEQTVRRLAESWTGSVQVTEPAASLLNVDDLLTDAATRYLVEHAAAQRGYRVKSDAVRLIKTRVREKLIERLGVVGRAYLQDDRYAVHGLHKAYEFDVAVGNGRPVFAAQAISFEIPPSRKLEKEISASAWLVGDVKDAHPDFPVAVFTLPPAEPHQLYDEALAIFRDVGAEIITEHQASEWAGRMVDLVPRPQVPRV